MATFVQTTLAKRTGSSTSVFSPATINGNVGTLLLPATYTALAPEMRMSSSRSNKARRTSVQFVLPQLDGATPPSVLSRPWGRVDLYIPDGTLDDDVNDLVGYINACTASGVTNLNDILVNGIGVY